MHVFEGIWVKRDYAKERKLDKEKEKREMYGSIDRYLE